MSSLEALELQLENRSKSKKKGAVKRLPASISVPRDATVDDIKLLIAKQAGIGDYNRLGLFSPATRKRLRNRTTVIGTQSDVVTAKSLLVQDLGPQIGWRTVYLIEYLGPLLFHMIFYFSLPHIRLPFFYAQKDTRGDPSSVQTLLFWIFTLHFIKRELETAFLHRFAANTMPVWFVFRNSAFYWGMAGFLSAFSIYADWSPFRLPLSPPRDTVTTFDLCCVAFTAINELLTVVVHLHLLSLRRPGTTEKGIPTCIGSSLVTCPNYMFEIFAWFGIIAVARDIQVVAFLAVGMSYMHTWGKGKERDLRQLFPDKYKKKRYIMLPGII